VNAVSGGPYIIIKRLPRRTVPTPTPVDICGLMPNKDREAAGITINCKDPKPERTVCAANRMLTNLMRFPAANIDHPIAA